MNILVYIALITSLIPIVGICLLNIHRQKELISENNKLKLLLEEKNNLINETNETNKNLFLEKNRLEIVLENQKDKIIEIMQIKSELKTEIKDQLADKFKLISNQILEQQREIFSREQQNGLGTILKPLKEQLENYGKKIQESKETMLRNSSSMETQINMLMQQSNKIANEANSLTEALRSNKKIQGNWGELALKNLLESVGLVENRDFFSQKSEKDSNGNRFILDFVILLPNGRKIIIDSKVSIVNYERYSNAQNREEKLSFMKAYYGDIVRHLKELGDKGYQHIYNTDTTDFVFMFLPLEGAYFDLVSYDRKVLQNEGKNSIFDLALKSYINIVSGTTLIPVLKMVEYLWNIEKQNKNITLIVEQSEKLYKKVNSFMDSMERMGNSLKNASKSYDDALKQIRDGKGNLLAIANKIAELARKKLMLGVNREEENEVEE